MATQTENPAVITDAQVVGNAFVDQYYHILHQSPELVYRFYQDSSVLGRPDFNGVMSSVMTMQGINDKILSFNYKDYIAEIKTADAQQSFGEGVTVLVTGYMTGRDNVRKKFVQSFFLAPQEKGYYVLNDLFRFVEDELVEASSAPVNSIVENAQAAPPLAPEEEQPSHIPDQPPQDPGSSVEDDLNNEPEVCDPSDNEDGSITEEEIVDPPIEIHVNERETTAVASAPPTTTQPQEDAPKQSYASILKAMKASPSPAPVKTPAKPKPPSIDQEGVASAKPVPAVEASTSTSKSGPEKANIVEEAEGYSVYVRNLPQNATPAQLEEVLAKFGSIKQGGVQVRSNKQGFCFGFVEFESSSSMHSAIEASPIIIGNRKAVIEEKRTTTRVNAGVGGNSGRGRYPSSSSSFPSSSRGGFRNEGFRGGRGGNYSGGRGFGRNDFRGPGEYSARPRRGPEGYQRVDQNGAAGNGVPSK